MASTNFRRLSADTLAAYISSNISGLTGKVFVGAAGPETRAPCLSLRVITNNFTFEPADIAEVYAATPDDGKVIVDVGLFSGSFQLQIWANSSPEREIYEQQITDLFLSSDWAPGVLHLVFPAVTVGGYSSQFAPEMTAYLDSDSWRDELSFEAKRMSFLDISIEYPALAVYNAVTLTSLQTAVTDPDQVVVTVADIDSGDQVEIHEDGTTTHPTV